MEITINKIVLELKILHAAPVLPIKVMLKKPFITVMNYRMS